MIYPFVRGDQPLDPLLRKVGKVRYEAFQRFVEQVGAARFLWHANVEFPFPKAHSTQAIYLRTEAALHSTRNTPLLRHKGNH
jgi:hypothetical protein